MKKDTEKLNKDVLEYQPDAVEIEERPVPTKIRWVLYVIIFSFVFVVVWAVVFKVDRIVVAEGKLLTTSPTIVIQSLNAAAVRSIEVQVGDEVQKGQIIATLDSTFASADLTQLSLQSVVHNAQIRRIDAELFGRDFVASPEEGQDGELQEQLFHQRKRIFLRNKQLYEEKAAALEAKQILNKVQVQGNKEQLKLFRDIEGIVARVPLKDSDYRLRLLEAQKSRNQTANDIKSLEAEENVIINELKQVKSEWHAFVEERNGKLLEEEVQLRNECEKISEEINKAKRLHELVSLKAPEHGVVLSLAERSVGSILQQAEPFVTIVPLDSIIEAEVDINAMDIARIRQGDSTRIKLDAFPFQRHDTLPGKVRVISENSFQSARPEVGADSSQVESSGAVYRARITILSTQLRDVPEGFRLMPGMKVRAEIKVGKRSIITYFLYPIVRAFDESLREP